MDERIHFERNMLALASVDPPLCKRLSAAETTRARYRFLNARNGDVVPAAVDRGGAARALHSLVAPEKEAQRLIDTVRGGFLVLLGLGGGYAAEAALARGDIQGLLIIDFDIDGIAELLASKDYVRIFGDTRCRVLIDPSIEELRKEFHELYRPALSGGISVLPLRPRVDADPLSFERMADAIKLIIDSISDDYSVQAYFGKRWFANIIRNIREADKPVAPAPPVKSIAITAAGPSLDEQLPSIREKRRQFFLLATDTSLPALLDADLKPDAVISIDCQHISYQHFMRGLPEDVPLYLDLASPPVVASQTRVPRFFSGGHPLAVYIARTWRSFPRVDTSGGNVTYAAVALAEKLGAERIALYGADFSYPGGASYARGTYIHPYFRRMQSRLHTLEGLFSSFVFRNVSLRKTLDSRGWRYETKPLIGYRERLEKLATEISAELETAEGFGAPVRIPGTAERGGRSIGMLGAGAARSSGDEFLLDYAQSISRLPEPAGSSVCSYIGALNDENRDVFTTLLPTAAAIRKREDGFTTAQVIAATKGFALDEIRKVIASTS